MACGRDGIRAYGLTYVHQHIIDGEHRAEKSQGWWRRQRGLNACGGGAFKVVTLPARTS